MRSEVSLMIYPDTTSARLCSPPMRRVALPLAVAGLAFAAPAAGASETGRLLVSVKPADGGPAQAPAATAVVARADARRAGHSVPQIGLVVVRPRAGESLR